MAFLKEKIVRGNYRGIFEGVKSSRELYRGISKRVKSSRELPWDFYRGKKFAGITVAFLKG